MMLDLYEQCEYKIYIITKKKKIDVVTNIRPPQHVDKNDSNIKTKQKMKQNKMNNIDNTKNSNNDN